MSDPLYKVLLLEDDLDLQELIVARLKADGFEFTTFSDPSEPLNKAKTRSDYFSQFDLILTDFKMPKIDGIDFIKQLRKSSSTTPIILMTAINSVELAVEAIHAGAYDFVVKPLDFAQLSLAMKRGLALKQLYTQNEILKSTIKSTWSISGIIGKSQAMQKVLDLAKRVANSSANVLIQGESGTGKELIAKAIHRQSARTKQPFVAINCASIPEALLESELFGHAKGSFTGAHEKKIGLLEEAEGGTLFLDEIGDLNLTLQAKLLRVLQERKIKRVGENTERSIDVRVLAATHKDLRKEVRDKHFREDLYFRLNVIQIRIPPLRERKDDIIPLAQHFFQKFTAQNDTATVKGFSKAALEHLLELPWTGNVRELENAIERAVILAEGVLVETADLPSLDSALVSVESEQVPEDKVVDNGGLMLSLLEKGTSKLPSLDEFSRLYVAHVLKNVGGIKEQAARVLEIDRKTLYRKLSELEKPATSTLSSHLM